MTRAPFAPPGSIVFRSPTSSLLLGPPTPSSPSSERYGCPLRSTYCEMDTCFLAADACAHERADAGDCSPGLHTPGNYSQRNSGLPDAWVILFTRAMIYDPAGCARTLTPLMGTSPSPSGIPTPWATGMFCISRLYPITAQLFACLRIAVRSPYRRKARYRAVGLHLTRAGFAPAGQQTGFHRCIAIRSLQTSLVWSHWYLQSHTTWLPLL